MPAYVKVLETVLPTKLSAVATKDALAQHHKARKRVQERIQQIYELKTAGAFTDAEQLIGAALSDPLFMLGCVPRAAENRPLHKRPLLESTFGIVADMLPLGAQPMTGTLRAQHKSSGGFRPICSFDMPSRVAQEAVRRVLEPYFVPRSFQYTHIGVVTAIKAIKDTPDIFGWWVAKLDIKENYGSFEFEKLPPELPLPKEVVEKVVLGRHAKLQDRAGSIPPVLLKSITGAARRGIPQGSICSPIVAAITVAGLGAPKGAVRLFNYADDFLLFAPTKAALQSASSELIAAVALLPGGTFDLIPKQIAQLPEDGSEAITFLGYRLMRDDTAIRAEVSGAADEKFSQNLNGFEDRLQDAYHSKMEPIDVIQTVAEFRAYTLAWCAAFAAADDIGDFKAVSDIAYKKYLKDFKIPDALVNDVLKILPPVKIEDVGSGT